MNERRRLGTMLGIAVMVAAACGSGATAATTAPGDASAAPTTASQESSQAPASEGTATQPPGATTAPTQASGGGGSVGSVCDLVTVAELEAILGQSPVVAQDIPGPPDTCDVQVNGAPTAAWVKQPENGKMIYDVLAGGPDAQKLGGIGDGAFYSANTQLLVFKKGDVMVSVAVTDVNMADDKRLEAQKAIAAKAAGRL